MFYQQGYPMFFFKQSDNLIIVRPTLPQTPWYTNGGKERFWTPCVWPRSRVILCHWGGNPEAPVSLLPHCLHTKCFLWSERWQRWKDSLQWDKRRRQQGGDSRPRLSWWSRDHNWGKASLPWPVLMLCPSHRQYGNTWNCVWWAKERTKNQLHLW